MSDYRVDTLANGLRLVSVPMPHLHVAELVCYLAVGGRNEPLAVTGISHFLEHMIFRGTAEYPNSAALERAFEAIGGAVNASTDSENTCFHSRVHPDFLREGLSLFASMLRRPRFLDLDVERRIILEEAREDYNEQGVLIDPDSLMAGLLWPGHPLGESLIGTPESLARIDLPSLDAYYRRWYGPENLVISACGRIDSERLKGWVEEQFGDWQGAASPAELPPPLPRDSGSETCWVFDSDSQVTLQLAFRLPGRRGIPSLPLRLLCRLLSGGGGARLPQRLREELGLTYAVEANCSLLDDTGYLAVELAVAPENLLQAVGELCTLLNQLREEAVGTEELQATVRSYLFDLDFSRDQTEAMAVRYGWGLQANYLRTLEQDCRELQQIDAACLQQLARDVFRRERLKLVVVGPWQKADRRQVAELLRDFPS